ncbi:hypothetical protein TPA0598_05_03850 [Streptomyces lydicamycinicus]|uniref:Uncharacterized protein n=1 Tax=Streptomyces lydicamycinicus TaxID=1546107 RepID=A0A0P4R9R3_9ACTN|nr:hypothetical protein TPA0598_05_03850 [Streptomyces lydicamycinicus]
MGQAAHLTVPTGPAPAAGSGLAPALHGTSNDPASTTTPTEAVRPTLRRDQRARPSKLSTGPSPGREKESEAFMPHTEPPPHHGPSMTG